MKFSIVIRSISTIECLTLMNCGGSIVYNVVGRKSNDKIKKKYRLYRLIIDFFFVYSIRLISTKQNKENILNKIEKLKKYFKEKLERKR